MDDRERVLMNIAVDTAGTVHDKMERIANGWQMRFRFDRAVAQFIPTEMAESIGMPMAPGDIVRCQTNPNHCCGISELVEKTGYFDFVLRMIGGDRLLKMSNESLDVLRFMAPHRLYTGAKYRIYKWASVKAFSDTYNPHGDYYKRCGGVEFDGDTLVIWCRPHIFVMEKKGDVEGETFYAQPKKFTLQWGPKTRLKDIIDAMNSQGFADDFEYGPEQSTDGQNGYTKISWPPQAYSRIREPNERLVHSSVPRLSRLRSNIAEY